MNARWQASVLLLAVLTAVDLGQSGPPARTALYDTGVRSPAALSSETVAARTGWAKLAAVKAGAQFKGDAALANEQMTVVMRVKADGAEIYGPAPNGATLRARLIPVAPQPLKLASVHAAHIEPDSVAAEAVYRSGGVEFRVTYSVSAGNPVVHTKPGPGVIGQRLEAPSRLGILPDFFADDMMIDAWTMPVDKVEIPAENFFMQMLSGGEAIVAAVWNKAGRDVKLFLDGDKEQRAITCVEISYGEGGSIWAGLLEGSNLWGLAEITSNNVGSVITLDWSPPFKAKWKGNFTRVDRTVDSWEFEYNPAPRRRWSGVAGNYELPCWFEGKDVLKARIQPPTMFPNGDFEGPFAVYPIDRSGETPIEHLTVADLMRNSLGVGPCEYIMDMAGQGVTNKGIYTCSIEHTVPLLFEFGLQKEERAYLALMMREVQVFVKAIQDRINQYVDFRQQLLTYLAEQKSAHPDLAPFIGRLQEQTKRIAATRAAGSEPVAKLANQILPEILSDILRVNVRDVCGRIAGVGLGQDNTVARCRHAVKVLRQMATIEMAVNPAATDLAKEVRNRTHGILRNPYGHEMR